MKKEVFVLSMFFLGLSLVGCQPVATTHYLGAKAVDMEVVSLADVRTEPQHWQDLYVTVDYRLGNKKEKILDIDGALTFSESVKANFTHVQDLKLKLFLLDKDLSVVDYLDIARTLSNNIEDETTFSKTVKLEKNVVAFTFGYEGSFVENDPTGSSVRSVWKLPRTKQ